jgi:hypothetical protein
MDTLVGVVFHLGGCKAMQGDADDTRSAIEMLFFSMRSDATAHFFQAMRISASEQLFLFLRIV